MVTHSLWLVSCSKRVKKLTGIKVAKTIFDRRKEPL